MSVQGKIIKGIGGFYYIHTDSGEVTCRARGKLRLDGVKPMVGDDVLVEPRQDGDGVLLEILPRRNSFIRPPVANIDVMVVVASQADPVSEALLLDRMTAIAVDKEIRPLMVINKCDLDPGDRLYDIYSKSGIETLRVSAASGDGRAELISALSGKVAAFSGVSGVGKSSILNMLQPGLAAPTGGLNEKIGRGRHTTRHVELFKLESGIIIADTPGFSSFDESVAEHIDKDNLQYAFPEFDPYLGQCRFTGCAHVKDSGCAVREAVTVGEISESRHRSYVLMYEKAKEVKEWETGQKKR